MEEEEEEAQRKGLWSSPRNAKGEGKKGIRSMSR